MMVDWKCRLACSYRFFADWGFDRGMARLLGRLCEDSSIYRYAGGDAPFPRLDDDRAGGTIDRAVPEGFQKISSGFMPDIQLQAWSAIIDHCGLVLSSYFVWMN